MLDLGIAPSFWVFGRDLDKVCSPIYRTSFHGFAGGDAALLEFENEREAASPPDLSSRSDVVRDHTDPGPSGEAARVQ